MCLGGHSSAPPPRALALLAALLAASPAAAAPPAALTRTLGGAEVDWAAGTITARGGAAADYRLPSADVARLGAERRARAAARAALKGALEALPRGGRPKPTAAELQAALDRARAVDVQYQSNGGVLLSLVLSFGELIAPAAAARTAGGGGPPERALAVPAMPLELAPRLTSGDKEGHLAWAVYRAGVPPSGVKAVSARRDKEGRLVLPREESELLGKLAREPAVIYVQKILR